MRLGIMSFTDRGSELAGKIAKWGYGEKFEITTYHKRQGEEQQASSWVREQFSRLDLLVVVGATGIAVRLIAPYLQKKQTDPAVLVIDEMGIHVISLLSGHLGGANEFTLELSAWLGAKPVITTATDLNQIFAVDVFAKKNKLWISSFEQAKAISAHLVNGGRAGFYSEEPVRGELPKELVESQEERLQIVISKRKKREEQEDCLLLIPQWVAVGIGCRKGKSCGKIQEVLHQVLSEQELALESIQGLYSVDLKKEEPGLQELAHRLSLPFTTFSPEDLEQVAGEFTGSDFVKQTVGIDNVCERSAVLGSKGGTLIQKKYGVNGVTIALAVEPREVSFE